MVINRSFWLMAFLTGVTVCKSALVPVLTLYTNDGQTVAREEAMRWFANRARYAPDKEKARLGGAYSVPAGPIAPLAPHQELNTPARRHSEDLAKTDTFTHNSPTGSLYYAAGATPGQRLTQEGYLWQTYGENIAAGYLDGRAAHEIWFNSDGHRGNMLSSQFLEIGVGYYYYASSAYDRYYTQDYGKRLNSTEHFFTDTLFFDANGNKMYDEPEAISGIEIYLKTQSVARSDYDISSVSGSFAIPIDSIRDGDQVEVLIKNTTGSAKSLSIPIDFDRVARVDLTNMASYSYGAFIQPSSQKNIGFRNVIPRQHVIDVVRLVDTAMAVRVETLIGATYALQFRSNLITGTWSTLMTTNATTTPTVFLDNTQATQRFYRAVFQKN